MSSIPTNLARVPQALSRQVILGTLMRTQRQLLGTEIQLGTGQLINRPSDDALATSAISVLDDIIERRQQRERNLSHAESVLNNVDAGLADVSDLLLEAKSVASSQIGAGSDAQTRANEAHVIDALLDELFVIANRQYQDIYFFGGSKTAEPPMVTLLNGIQYRGEGKGLETDLGLATGFPITISADEAFGATSARVEGARDLDPTLTNDTRLVNLAGAKGLGIRLGSINADVNGNDITIDLSSAHTIGDIAATIEQAVQTELDASFPGESITVQIDPATGNRLEITPSAGANVTFSDLSAEATATDLGIDQAYAGGSSGTGGDLDPRLTQLTPLANLTGVTFPLGTLRVTNAGQTRDVDLSGATTVQDLQNTIAGLHLGIRVEINESGDRLNFVNELSGSHMTVEEVAGGTTASELGVRSFDRSTRLEEFNDGVGVQIISGNNDPVTGLPDPARDLDFRVTVKDGRTIDVDLVGAADVGDVLDRINAAAAAAGLTVGAGLEFEARLVADGNGIALEDNTVGAETVVTKLNGSFAAENLGILGSTTGAVLAGEDRAKVAVDGLFSRLIALRDALETNDERGITIAGEGLEKDISRVSRTRAEVGVRASRVQSATERQEDLRIQDEALRSEIRDLDYTEAAIRFATLQQQLEASLATAGRVTSLSLLDFLR